MEQKQDGAGQGERRRGSEGSPAGDIKDFLLARVAEDEAVAQAAIDDDCGQDEGFDFDQLTGRGPLPLVPSMGDAAAQLVARSTPRRWLAECTAKRSIIEAFDPEAPFNDPYVGHPLLSMLASIYADHPDYQPEWAA